MINEEENKQKAPAMDWDGNVVEEANKSNPQAMDWEGNVIEATATEIPAEQVKKKDIFSESTSIPQAVRPMESTSRPVSGWGGVLSATGKADEAPQQKTIAFDEREAQREAQRRATGKQGESPLKVVAQKQEISKDVQALAAAKRTEDQIREEQRAANLKGTKDTYGYSEAWQLTNQLDVQRGVLEKFADADAKQIKLLLDEAEKLNINDSSYQLLSDNIQKNISTGNLAGAEELRNDWNDRLKKLKQIEYKVRPLQAKLKYATDRITKFNDEREYIAENYWGAGLDKLSAGLGSTYAMLLRTPGFVEEYLRNVAGGIMGESQGGVDVVTAFRDTQTPFGSLEKGADYFEKQSENQLYVAQNAYKRYEQSISEAFSNGDYASGLDMLWRGSLESVPTTAAIATLSYMGVPPGLITAGGGVVFAAGKFDELKKENPYMDRGLMYTNAFFTGYAESLSEILGTGLIVRQAQKLYKIGGKKAVDKFAKDSWEAIYERNMKRYFPLVGAAEEGGTEAINAYTSNIIDIASGVDPNRDPMKGVWDAFYVGSAMGAPTAIIASYAVRKSEEKNKKYEEYLKKLSELNNAASKPNLPDDVRDDINNQAQAVADELNNFLVYEKSMFNNMPEQTQKRAAYLINQIDKYEESRDNLKDPVVTENLNNRIAAMQNELGNILSDYNKQKGEVQDLAKYTSGTKEKYGYIDRGDGKGKIDLTQEEYEAEQAKMQPKVDEQVTPTAEGERVEEVKLAELPTKTIQAEVVEEKPTIITNEKEPTKKEDGEPMSGGVQGVRPEGQAGKESAELRAEKEEVADPLKDVESTAKALEGADATKLGYVKYEDAIIVEPQVDFDNLPKGNDELSREARSQAIRDQENKPPKYKKYPIGTRAVDRFGEVYELREVPLDEAISKKEGTQREATIDKYAEWIKQGNEMPPAKGVENFATESGKVKITDGNHRYQAAKKAGLKTIPVWVALTDKKNTARPIYAKNEISEAYHKAKADGSNHKLVKAVEELLGKPLNEITVEDYRAAEAKRQSEKEPTEKQIADTAQKAGVTPKNLRDLYKINRELFGLDRIKSLASAIAMDRMVGVMAKRAGITKEQMYGRLKFEKDTEANALKADNALFQGTVDGKPVTLRNLDVDVVNGFYSPIEKNLKEYGKDKIKAKDWLNVVGKGDEAVFTGVRAFLEGKDPNAMVSKQEILDYMKDNRISVSEVVKGGNIIKKDEAKLREIESQLESMGFTLELDMGGEGNMLIDRDGEIAEYEGNEDAYALLETYNELSDTEFNQYSRVGQDDTKFSQYQLEGEKENYKEVLVTLPNKVPSMSIRDWYDNVWRKEENPNAPKFEELTDIEYDSVGEEWRNWQSKAEKSIKFKSTHFNEPNILVHLRMNTRTDADGNKVLFLEEVQSDWGQKGKKEGFGSQQDKFDAAIKEAYNKHLSNKISYNEEDLKRMVLYEDKLVLKDIGLSDSEINNLIQLDKNRIKGGVIKAPFVMDTNAWTKLGLKVALKEAVKQGADKIAWTTGTQQFDRWGTEKIDWVKKPEFSQKRYDELKQKIKEDKASDLEIDEFQSLTKSKTGGWTINIQEQFRGTAFAGMNIDEKALSEKGITITSKEDLKAAIDRTLSREKNETERQKLTDRIWDRMQKEDSGTSLPRKEGMESFYGTEGTKGMVGGVAEKVFGQKVGTVEIQSENFDTKKIQYLADKYDVPTYMISKVVRLGDLEGQAEIGLTKDEVKVVEMFLRGSTTQPSIDITPALRAEVERGLALFQRQQGQQAKGAMVAADGAFVIYALTDPNVSTPLHEMAHVFEHYLTDAERAAVQNWAGTKAWDTQTSEKFARGFEKYLAEGKAPTPALQKIFEKFKQWLTDIYNGITGSDIDIELNEPMREIYAKMLGLEQSLQSTPQAGSVAGGGEVKGEPKEATPQVTPQATPQAAEPKEPSEPQKPAGAEVKGEPKEATPQATPQAAEEQLEEPKAEVVSEAQAQPAGEIAFTAPTAEVKEQPKGLLKPRPGSLSVKVGEANQMGRASTVAYGDNVEIVMADGTIRQGRYAAVEAEDVLFSHNEEVFNDTDGFPEYDGKNANSRNYKGDKSASGNVDNYARNLIPSVVLADSATPSEGSPIVSTDKIGVSGNNRGMSIKRAIKMYPEKYAEYRKKLEERAKRLGIDPEQLRGMKNPMLVRIDSDVKEYTPAEFDKYNKDAQKAESPIDFRIKQSRIIQGSKSLREGIYKILGDFETVGELWNNRSAVRQLFELLQQNKLITAAELPAYINADGTITEAGKDYVGDVAVGTILSDDTIKATENIKSFRNKVLTVLPLLAKNYSFGTDYSLSNEINEALRIQSDFANSGFPADKFLNWAREINMYGRNYTENGMAMNRIIDASSTSGKGGNKLKEILTRYNNSAAGSQGALLFEEERVSKEEAFDSMRSILDKETNDTVIAYGKMEENEEAASERERRASEARRSEQELGDTDESILKQIDNGDGTYSPTNEKQAEVFFRVVTKMSPQMAAANAQLVEARANGWASLTGKPKSEFYTGVAFEYADPNAKVGNRGKWRKSTEKNKKIITLTPKYNSSTLVHELLGHDYFDDIIQAGREDLLMALINEWKNYSGNKLSVERVLEILKNFDPTKKTGTPEEAVAVAIHEFFANGAEQYMKDPQSIPNEKLRDLFELFRQWLAATMNMFSQKGIEITSFMRDVYAAGLGGAGLSHVDTSNMVNKRSNDDTSEYIKESISGKTSENISSGLNELFQLGDFVEIIDGWYSPIERNVKEYGKDKIKAKDWLNVVGKGDEAVFTGVRAFLEGKDPNAMVSKQEILDYMKDNRISVVEVVKEETPSVKDSDLRVRFDGNGFTIDVNKKGISGVYIGLDELDIDYNGENYEEVEAAAIQEGLSQIRGGKQGDETKFSQYQLEGEKENYKEIMVILPRTGSMAKVGDYKVPSAHQYGEDLSDNRRLVHLRMNTRTDADGKKVLFLEEVQSDWGQKWKKEGFKVDLKPLHEKQKELRNKAVKILKTYNDYDDDVNFEYYSDDAQITIDRINRKNPNATQNDLVELKNSLDEYDKLQQQLSKEYQKTTPSAPFVMDTNAWTKLGLKVALKEAVAQGVDKIAWTTGEQQNDRYDLSKQVDEVGARLYSDGTYGIVGRKDGKAVFEDNTIPENKLADYVGKELAEKIIANASKEQKWQYYEGNDLKMGGKGMKGFYGSMEEGSLGIVGNVAKSLFGQEPGTINIRAGEKLEIRTAKDGEGYFVYSESGKSMSARFDTKSEAQDFINKNKKGGNVNEFTQPSIDITPELKAQVQEGLPLFQESERDQKIRNGLRELAVSGYRDKLTDKHNVSRWAKTLLKPELHPYIDEMLDELQALDVPENGQRFHETAEELLADPSIPEQVKTEIRQNRVRSYDPKSLYEALKNAEATIDTIGLNNALNAIRNNKTDFDFPFVSAVFRRINAEIRDLNRRGLKEEAKKLMEQSAILAEELINEASTRGSKLNEVKALYLLSPDGRVQFLKRRWNKMNEGRNAKVKDVVKQLKNELNKALSGIDYLINENFKEETKREELNEQIVALRTEIEAMEAARDRMPKEGGYDSKKGAKIKVPKENRPSLVAQIKAQRAAMKSQGLMQTDVSELDPSLQLAYSLLDDNSIGLKTFKKRFEKEIDEQISWEEAAELYNNAVLALKDNGSSIKYETAEQVNLDAEANSAEAAAKLAEKQMRAAIKQAQMQAAQQAAQAQRQAAQQAAQAQKQAAQQAAYSPATDVAETVVKAVKNIMGLVTPKQKTILEQIVKKLKDKSFDYLPEVAKKSATPDELLAFAIDNMVSLQGQAIWNDAVAEVMDMIANDPNMTASEKAAADTLLNDFYNVVFDTVLPKSNQWKIIQEAIINHGEYVTISPSGNASINWSKLIQSGQQKKTNWKISVFDEIINMLPAGSQNDPATQKVLNVLLNRIDTILEDKKNVIAQRQLDNAKKTIAGRTVSTKKSARKNNALQVVRLFNTGALDDASALPIFEEYFGMANPDWNRIKQLSELIEKAPTGNLASRAIEELAFEMERAMPGMGQKILDSYFYNNMLSSPITFIKNLSSLAKNFILAVGSTATTLDANYLKAFRKGYTMGDFGDILLYGGLNQGSNLDVMVMADGMPVTRPLEYINANNILMQVVKSTRVVSRLLEATDAANQRAATEMQQYKSLKQYLKQQNVQDVRATALKILRGENVSDVEKQSLEAEVRQTQREFGLPETGSSFMREYYRRLREIALAEVGYDESQAAMEEERGVEAGLRSTYRTPLKYDGFFTGLGKMLSDVFQSANKGIESSDNPIAKKIAKGFLGATKKITFPFLKVPANLFESGLELIPPYGMLKYGTIAALNYTKTPITDAEKLKSAITKDRVEQYFRGSAGAYLLLGGLAYLLIKASKSWDEDPENKDKPKTGYNPPMTIGSRDAGESMISPNSITMFGKTIGMGWFGEYGVPISAVMIYFDLERERETRKALSKDLQERSLIDDESFFKEYMNRLGGYFLSTSVLTGSDNIMRIWQAENDMGGKMAKTGMTYAYNQFIPFSSFIRQGIEVGKSASGIRAQKPVTTSEYVWSALAMQGVATEERPALDIFGDPIRPIQKGAEGVGVITQFIDPVRFEEYKMWWADVNPGYLKSTYSDYSKNMVDVESKNGVDFYKYEEMVRKMYGENVYSMYDNKEYRNLTDTELESMKNIPENEAIRIAYREDLREMWNITRRYGIIRQRQDMGYLDVTQAKELKELRNAMFKLRKLYLPKYESYRENRNAEKNLREAVDYELSGDLIEE